ncbi:MAG TPA: efflux RND transporter periplasmic adaptor subunit, partial [Acidobacteria bacterium]|nr:efflux RND transporter periplasmic adaptor subunit [Acidobacteriota bacterium]
EEACLAADLAAKELVRTEGLARAGIASDQQLDAASTDKERTAAACAAARAMVAEARASVRSAEVQVELTELRAPFDGVLAQVSTEVGEWITPSPPGVPIPPVFDLLDPTSLYISAPIDEVDSERVKTGQTVRITVDSRPGVELAGHVVRVAPYVEDVLEQNRTVEVECELDDPAAAEGLLPGTSADVEIVIRQKSDVLRVPTAAIGEGGTVLVLANGKLEERKITTGLGNWELTEVVSGLREGELVVTLRDSTAVKPGVRAVPRS